MKAVLADDERIALKMVNKLIDWKGLDLTLVGWAENGPDLLELIREKKPDIVVTDIMMPGMTGLEIIAKALEEGMTPRFVITSAYANFTYAQTAMRLGVRDFLEKPVDSQELNQALKKIVKEMPVQDKTMSAVSAVIRTVKNYIDDHYAQKITLENVSNEAYVSPNYLSGLFKKEMGVNFSEYLTEVRINKAKVLLGDLKYSIEEISGMVGFKDSGYFCSVFRKKVGCSPTEFRKKN